MKGTAENSKKKMILVKGNELAETSSNELTIDNNWVDHKPKPT